MLMLGLKISQNLTPLITQNLDHPVSRQIPPLSLQYPVHITSPSNLVPHSPISSPSYSNTNQKVRGIFSWCRVPLLKLALDSAIRTIPSFLTHRLHPCRFMQLHFLGWIYKCRCRRRKHCCLWFCFWGIFQSHIFTTLVDNESVYGIFFYWYPTDPFDFNNPSIIETIIS